MGKLWVCVLFATVVAANVNSDEWKPEDWDYYDDYDSPLLYDDAADKVIKDKISPDYKNIQEIANDYQIEDNRSAPNDENAQKTDDKDTSKGEEQEVVPEETSHENDEAKNSEAKEAGDVVSEEGDDDKEILLYDADVNPKEAAGLDAQATDVDSAENKQAKSENENSDFDTIKETQSILKEDQGNDFAVEQSEIQNSAPASIIEETNKLLEETLDNFEEKHDVAVDEDTVDKVYADLDADLAKLLDTWKKLNTDTDLEINPDDTIAREDYEDKLEQTVQKAESDTQDAASESLKNKVSQESMDGTKTTVKSSSVDDKNIEANDEAVEDASNDHDDSDYDDDSDEEENNDDAGNDNDANDKEFSNDDDTIDKVAEKLDTEEVDNFNILFDQIEKDKSSSVQQPTSTPTAAKESASTEAAKDTGSTAKTMDVSELTPAQYDQVMAQFRETHKDEMDLVNDELGKNVAVEHVFLSLDEATVITSPGYPSPYPTNNIVDWRLTGDGVGIELNITDFQVNGALGDYLLIKPGGVDESGTGGLVFSYRLNEPRRYRFLDVSQMFVRFVSQQGLAFNRGFSMSVKMIAPVQIFEKDASQPEAILPEPEHTLTVHVGGMTLSEFRDQEEQFRLLLADMAVLYINRNDIDQGMNTTVETTQIVRTGACNINWPGAERCARVTFGIPLVYQDGGEARLNVEDLDGVWALRTQEPFAAMMSRMGLMEFEAPSDSRATLIWSLIAVAVVGAMVVVGLALWRFSCLENYSRMPQYSDRDSVYSAKQGLDLYPTPHQTLPPLYSDADYKWVDAKYDDSARVDMGGFTNKSYTRDMYDMDSDDDIIIAPRKDRKPGGDSYEV